MKKYLIIFLFCLFVPFISYGQLYSSTVSKIVNPVVKKYTPTPVMAQDDAPATSLGKKKGYDPLIALLQAKLTNLGTDPGPVDGVSGIKTKKALQEVQRFFGIKADGVYGKESQNLFAVLPINSSIREANPVIRIALRKYTASQLVGSSTTANNTNVSTKTTKLATIPFTPKGINQVLSKSLASVGLTQVSEGLVSGKKVTAKPKITKNGARVALYTISPSGVSSLAGNNSFRTNFSSTNSEATNVYVCGNVKNTSICVPVSFEVADAINSGVLTLEQYLASKSANGDICIQCFLDENGDLGVISGGESSGPIIPTGPTVVNAANIVNMCVDYPARGTGNVAYEITFDKPINVMYSSGLKLEIIRYYNAPSKKIVATYVGAPDGTLSGKTIRFHAPAGQMSSIYYEGEATLKSTGGAKIVVSGTGEAVDLNLLTDIFRFSNTCSNSGSSYDIIDTSVDLLPSQLYSGESFDSPRLNVNLKFKEPVIPTAALNLVMNPSDSGGTAIGKLVSGTVPSDTLTFHFNLTTGSSWSNILGNFSFDPNSGSVKGSSGKNMLLNMLSGADSTGGTCAMKYIGQPCLDLVGSEAKYTVYYTRKLDVTNANNNSIRLKIEPLNPSAPDVIANLTNYDEHHLYFSAPAATNLISDYTGHYWLQVDPPSRVFTINSALGSVGSSGGGDADPDMGVSSDTCSSNGGNETTVSDLCMISSGKSYVYLLKFSEPVTVVGVPELKIQKNSSSPIVTATYNGYDGTDLTTLKFIAETGSGLNTGIGGQYYEGVANLSFINGSSIKNVAGQNVPTVAGAFSFSDVCTTINSSSKILSGTANYRPLPMQGEVVGDFRVDYNLTFDTPVLVIGTPKLKIINDFNGQQKVSANYVSGSGTTTLQFHASESSSSGTTAWDIDYEGTGIFDLNGGSIVDAFGINADTTIPASVVFDNPLLN